jgi:hypothetical protein
MWKFCETLRLDLGEEQLYCSSVDKGFVTTVAGSYVDCMLCCELSVLVEALLSHEVSGGLVSDVVCFEQFGTKSSEAGWSLNIELDAPVNA